ncbi:hypothetical protein M1O12_04230 [Dehalococcoidia bacterium]|nr:hypothetical protein [Dehalococcoidia bacterium]MCL0092743.1 hypothetical protein [Dehalococcoidia bacterium]
MEPEVLRFSKRHPELELLATTSQPGTGTVYHFVAPDGVRVNVSLDLGRWRHMSFSKRQPPSFRPTTTGKASDGEMACYLDFFGDVDVVRSPSPLGTGVCHFYEVGHPEARPTSRNRHN